MELTNGKTKNPFNKSRGLNKRASEFPTKFVQLRQLRRCEHKNNGTKNDPKMSLKVAFGCWQALSGSGFPSDNKSLQHFWIFHHKCAITCSLKIAPNRKVKILHAKPLAMHLLTFRQTPISIFPCRNNQFPQRKPESGAFWAAWPTVDLILHCL